MGLIKTAAQIMKEIGPNEPDPEIKVGPRGRCIAGKDTEDWCPRTIHTAKLCTGHYRRKLRIEQGLCELPLDAPLLPRRPLKDDMVKAA